MFNRKREEKPKRNNESKNLAQYGLFDVPTDLSFAGVNDDLGDDDSDLEAELLALTSGAKPQPKPKPKPVVPPTADLDAMVASSMKDISDEEDVSADENDPDLMDELKELTQDATESEPVAPEPVEPEPVQPDPNESTKAAEGSRDSKSFLDSRLEMYQIAAERAEKMGESGRARRFNRGAKTLKDLIRQVKAGQMINEDAIPPAISLNYKPNATTSTTTDGSAVVADTPTSSIDHTPSVPVSSTITVLDDDAIRQQTTPTPELIHVLQERLKQYKAGALFEKQRGNISEAVQYMKIAKQFEIVMIAAMDGEEVDVSGMPGPPNEFNKLTQEGGRRRQDMEMQQHVAAPEETTEEPQEQLITAGSVAEALQQRLGVYKKQEEMAKTEGNSSKARRMGRIVKQYEQAIKNHAAGKPIVAEDLPTPPGYAPLPINPPAIPSTSSQHPPSTPQTPDLNTPSSSKERDSPRQLPRAYSTRKMGNKVSTTHLEKQVALLLSRQREFKEAALAAKRKGEMEQAKQLLKTAKGFDKVIDAARGGFPIDMDSLPIPASSRSILDESFEVVLAEQCQEVDPDSLEMLTRLDEQLTKQLKMCLSTRDHHKALGDVTGVNRFENLALSVTKDLDVVRLALRTMCAELPKFHYENRSFSIVKCCTDLNDNDVELSILRGINYNCSNPKEIDTYVRFEFPYPQEDTYKERTTTIKDTNNPEYNATYTIPIQRTSRQCLRIFKRHAVKLEVFAKGGFFRSDQLLGVATVKLQPLETQCELHDSFDLMDGRKKAGGKLEIRLRVRHPLVNRQVEQITEKWLVLDH